MIWIECRERLPINGQQVWYYGPAIGVWRGHYEIDKTQEGQELFRQYGVPPHLFVCGEQSWGVVDSDDAPWWMPYEDGAERPEKPQHD